MIKHKLIPCSKCQKLIDSVLEVFPGGVCVTCHAAVARIPTTAKEVAALWTNPKIVNK